MTGRLGTSIERVLYRRGFTVPDARGLVRTQILFAALATVFCFALAALAGALPWGLAFGAGALLVTVNFYHLARFVQQVIYVQGGVVTAALIRFYGRLILSGVVLYGLLVWARLPVGPLLAGLSTVLASSLAWGLSRYFGNNVKEA